MTRWSDDDPNPNTTYADAYDDGADAFDQGMQRDECPHSEVDADARIGWLDGYGTQEARRCKHERVDDEETCLDCGLPQALAAGPSQPGEVS